MQECSACVCVCEDASVLVTPDLRFTSKLYRRVLRLLCEPCGGGGKKNFSFTPLLPFAGL